MVLSITRYLRGSFIGQVGETFDIAVRQAKRSLSDVLSVTSRPLTSSHDVMVHSIVMITHFVRGHTCEKTGLCCLENCFKCKVTSVVELDSQGIATDFLYHEHRIPCLPCCTR